MPLLRDVLNRIRWHPKERGGKYTIIIADRKAMSGFRTLHADSIVEIHASYFLYEERGDLTHIPLHHVVRVVDESSGALLWEKRSRKVG